MKVKTKVTNITAVMRHQSSQQQFEYIITVSCFDKLDGYNIGIISALILLSFVVASTCDQAVIIIILVLN